MAKPTHPTFDGHGLGALRQHPDPRDRLYSRYLEEDEHDAKKLRNALPESAMVEADQKVPIFDQGNLGSCTANEGVAHYMILQAVEGKPVAALSRLQVYRNARMLLSKSYANVDSGATGRAVASTLRNDGACLEKLWRYTISKFTQEPPERCDADALNHQLIQYLAIRSQRSDSLDLIKTSLAAGYPVGFSFDVYSNFRPDSAGLIPMPKGTVEGGHRMMLVGYEKQPSGEYFFTGRNSWGVPWGDGGRCLFHQDHVYQFMSDLWTYRSVE